MIATELRWTVVVRAKAIPGHVHTCTSIQRHTAKAQWHAHVFLHIGTSEKVMSAVAERKRLIYSQSSLGVAYNIPVCLSWAEFITTFEAATDC